MKLTATVRGTDAISLRAKYLIAAARLGLRAGADEAASIIQQEAAALAPQATGELAASIRVDTTVDEPERQERAVVAGAPHAMFVEYGTGLTGAAAPHPELPTTGVPITGSWVYDYKNQNWHGQAAQPYMRPALDGKGPEAIKAIKDSVIEEIQSAYQSAWKAGR